MLMKKIMKLKIVYIHKKESNQTYIYIIEKVPLRVKDIYLCLLKMDSQVL